MKRINMYLKEEDRSMVRFLQERYGLDNESSVIRFLIRKAAKEEGYPPIGKEEPGSEQERAWPNPPPPSDRC
jgi:hypothetical protein